MESMNALRLMEIDDNGDAMEDQNENGKRGKRERNECGIKNAFKKIKKIRRR